MPDIMPHELVRVAEKLEKVFGNFNVIVKVGLPNVIALSCPMIFLSKMKGLCRNLATNR